MAISSIYSGFSIKTQAPAPMFHTCGNCALSISTDTPCDKSSESASSHLILQSAGFQVHNVHVSNGIYHDLDFYVVRALHELCELLSVAVTLQ